MNNLDAEDLDGGEMVVWKGEIYEVGNRRHELVELYKNGEFIRIVRTNSLKDWVNNKYIKDIVEFTIMFKVSHRIPRHRDMLIQKLKRRLAKATDYTTNVIEVAHVSRGRIIGQRVK